MITCTKCGQDRHENDYYKRPDGKIRRPCKPCDKANVAAWRSTNRERRNESINAYFKRNPERHAEVLLRMRENNLSRWNLSIADYDTILERQSGGCAICGTVEPGGGRQNFCVDHDHSCCEGQRSCGDCIRGLLCLCCNRALGLMRDNPTALLAAVIYLEDQ